MTVFSSAGHGWLVNSGVIRLKTEEGDISFWRYVIFRLMHICIAFKSHSFILVFVAVTHTLQNEVLDTSDRSVMIMFKIT